MNKNVTIYDNSVTVNYYRMLSGLQPCEKYLFEKYVSEESRILDIGIGAGRTTGFLIDRGLSYIGVDLSIEMVAAAKAKFPTADLRVMDAQDLSYIDSESKDVIIFSFNGIDNVPSKEGRAKVFAEVSRCLVRGGVFIYSCHNSDYVLELPVFSGATPLRQIWRILRAVAITIINVPRLFEPAFRSGSGFRLDKIHGDGGLICHVGSREFLLQELNGFGFECNDIVGNRYPQWSPVLASNWFYLAGRKR